METDCKKPTLDCYTENSEEDCGSLQSSSNDNNFLIENIVIESIRLGSYAILRTYLEDYPIDIQYISLSTINTKSLGAISDFSSSSFPLPLALVCCKQEGFSECLKLLLDHGMTLGPGQPGGDLYLDRPGSKRNRASWSGFRTPMNIAVVSENWDAVNILLDRGYSCMDRDPATNLLPGEQALLFDEYAMAIKLNVHDGLILDEVENNIPISDFDFGNKS